MKWNTLFLDRDGVINVRNFDGYITSVENFVFAENAIRGLQQLYPFFERIIVVTNQQCIAKNIISRSNLDSIHRYMMDQLANAGVIIDAVFVAENERGATEDRRKPLPIMGLEAKEQFPNIQFENSLMVGDTDSDIQFGINLGMKTALVKSKEKTILLPDFLVTDLEDLVEQISALK
jgi:D-glycero-D-manno-heptose 1,7-bisphosphate phosphatase